MNRRYILNEQGEPEVCDDLDKWARAFESSNQRVDCTVVGAATVSTVFLALDHAYDGGAPVLWETMVFGGPHDQHQERCSGGREQAKAMHRRVVGMVRAARKKAGAL